MNTYSMHDQILTAVWEVAQEPLFILYEDGTIQRGNLFAQRMIEHLPGMNFLQLCQNPEDFTHAIQKSVRTNQKQTVSIYCPTVQSAAPVEFTLRIHPLTDENERIQPLLLASLQRKTTDLKVLEEAARMNDERVERLSMDLISVSRQLLEKTLQLAEQKNKLSTIIDGMAEGLLSCDDQGTIIHFNETARDFLNLPEGDLARVSLKQVCADISDIIRFDEQEPSLVKKQVLDVSLYQKELRVSVSPIHDEARAVGFVLILQDRTQQAELDRMKSDLISIVSHELRSPLTSIKGYVDLMIAGDLGEIPEFMRSYLDIVSTNANRLAMLIDDMLDLSRIETGKLNMSFGKVDVKYLCDYVYLTMKPQAEQKQMHLEQKVQSGLTVSGDVDRLQQALTNLVSNAIKYTPVGGQVQIQAERQEYQVSITVLDNGFGIHPEEQKKLFQKFFRVKNENTRNIGGTGLGLCITKSIVEAHEGSIHFESKPGKGSTFQMLLPLFLT